MKVRGGRKREGTKLSRRIKAFEATTVNNKHIVSGHAQHRPGSNKK